MTPGEQKPGASHRRAIEQYCTERAARKYPASYRPRMRDRREQRRIVSALAEIPPGARVLDLPCGTGRLTGMLVERGYTVSGADSSPNMVAHATRNWEERGAGVAVDFSVRDVMDTGFPDDAFGGVMCNRLFHHLLEPESRRSALRELRRISTGPIIVSFFNSFAFDALRRRIRLALRGVTPTDRIPISMKTFMADVHAAGLRKVRAIPSLWGVSPQWYLVLRRA